MAWEALILPGCPLIPPRRLGRAQAPLRCSDASFLLDLASGQFGGLRPNGTAKSLVGSLKKGTERVQTENNEPQNQPYFGKL